MADDRYEPAVPSELEGRLEELDKQTSDGDTPSSIDEITGDVPDICPECGGQLTLNSVFTDADGEAVAVRLTCRSTHEGGRIATYLYAVDRNVLYLEDESEPGDDRRRWGDDDTGTE